MSENDDEARMWDILQRHNPNAKTAAQSRDEKLPPSAPPDKPPRGVDFWYRLANSEVIKAGQLLKLCPNEALEIINFYSTDAGFRKKLRDLLWEATNRAVEAERRLGHADESNRIWQKMNILCWTRMKDLAKSVGARAPSTGDRIRG